MLASLVAGMPLAVFAYGPQGHLVAGRAAEPLLCPAAAAAVERLTPDQDLGEVGLWADRIRSLDDYADSGPWHYMNIADNAQIANFRHPPEGDVLEAIERYSNVLADTSLHSATRGEALRFLVHFIADIHQPLHVGRAADRGGNSITIRFDSEATNLHRFWDTHAIEWALERDDVSLTEYTAAVAAEAAALSGSVSHVPGEWAEESLSHREQVYQFGLEHTEPATDYLDYAADLTRTRLALAGARIAGTLNAIYCVAETG